MHHLLLILLQIRLGYCPWNFFLHFKLQKNYYLQGCTEITWKSNQHPIILRCRQWNIYYMKCKYQLLYTKGLTSHLYIFSLFFKKFKDHLWILNNKKMSHEEGYHRYILRALVYPRFSLWIVWKLCAPHIVSRSNEKLTAIKGDIMMT